MRQLRFTQYSTAQDTRGSSIITTWPDFVQTLSQPPRRGQKDGPAIVFAEIDGRRAKKNVVAIHAIGLDFDTLTEDELLARLALIDQFEYLAHTTYSHSPAQPKIRVILPLAEPVFPDKYPDFRKRLDLLIPGSDPQTVDCSRLFYLPACPPDSPSDPEVEHHPGRWLAVDDLPQVIEHAPLSANQVDEWRRRLPRAGDQVVAELGKKLVSGEPLESLGQRHGSILALTFYLAKKDPQIPREVLDELFRVSISRMPGKTLDEVWTAYTGGAARLEQELNEKQTGGRGKYTPEEIEAIARAQRTTQEGLAHRWIVQSDGGGWVLTNTGDYAGLFSRHDLPLAIAEHLSRAPVGLFVTSEKGGLRARASSEVIRDAGRLAQRIVTDMTSPISVFNSTTGTMHEAVCRRRSEINPRHYPEIDKWLQLLAGDEYPRLVDWISAVTHLDELLCIVYLNGPKGSGKSLLAHGLAKIWTSGNPTPLSEMLSGFNASILDCPLIFADEKLPKKHRWDTITEDLREMVACTDRELTRKFKTPSKLHGAIRLMLAANHEYLLQSVQAYTREDQEAIAQRLFYLCVPQAATDYLETLPRETKKQWGRHCIAEHALWLAEHHTIANPGDRFLVEGGGSLISRLVVSSAEAPNQVVEWLTRYLDSPNNFHNNRDASAYIKRRDGRLLVNVEALIRGWEIYMSHVFPRPDTARLSAALRSISLTNDKKQLRGPGGKQVRYHVIDTAYLYDYSARNAIGDPEAMAEVLKREVSDKTVRGIHDPKTTSQEEQEDDDDYNKVLV